MNRLVLRCPELTLKGRNRGLFERILVENIRQKLQVLDLHWPVRLAHGRVYVKVDPRAVDTLDPVMRSLSEVAGVESLSASVWLRPGATRQQSRDPNLDLIAETVVGLAEQSYEEDRTFAVRVNRVDKRFAVKSIDLERRLGQAVRDETAWDRVDLGNPDCLLAIDVYPDGMYFRVGKIPGIGGLPVGTGGRVLALLSGGIDSPVAAFQLATRGCNVDFFHLSATYAQQRDEDTPVVRLARSLSRFTLRSRLFTAPATHLDLALTGPYTGHEALLFRRFLVRAGAVLARRLGARALVTGDSVGQVASQTLENLAAVYQATSMPILQPLIGSNKQKTIETSRRIGTYEISIEPYKDCCALLTLRPQTHSEPDELAEIESQRLPEYDRLIDSTLADLVWRTFECGADVGDWRVIDEDPAAPVEPRDTSVAGDTPVAVDAGDDGAESGER